MRAKRAGLALVLLLSASGCTRLRVVVPNDYEGEVSLIWDADNGVAVKRDSGIWVFNVPDAGELRISDDSMLRSWHQATVFYRDGRAPVVVKRFAVGGASEDGRRSATDLPGTAYVWVLKRPAR